MNAIILRVTVMLAFIVGVTAVAAQAQTSPRAVNFTVPFEFNVSNEVLPAGDYTVFVENQTVRFRKNDGKANVIALSRRTVNPSNTGSRVKLTFRHYGDQYYLSQVWVADGVGRELKMQRKGDKYLAQDSRIVEVQGIAR